MTTKKRIRAQDLMNIYKEGEIFQAYVDHNPYGDGGRTKLQFVRHPSNISSYRFHQRNIGGVSYEWNDEWSTRYAGFFEIVEEEPAEVPATQPPTMIDNNEAVSSIVEQEVNLFLQTLGYKDYESVYNDPALSLGIEWLGQYSFEIKLYKLTNQKNVTIELKYPILNPEI